MSSSPVETAGQAFWHNQVARIGLGLAIVLNLLLFVLVLLAKQRLQEAIVASSADHSAQYSALVLPIIGLVAWLVGGALGAYYHNVRNEAPIANIIWGTVVLIELATWVPAITLILNL